MSYLNKLNIYTCEKCKAHIVTKDIDDGVTSFLIPGDKYCPNRNKIKHDTRDMMQSSMYKVYDQSMRPDYVWYKPKSTLGLTLHINDHVERGGLMIKEYVE